MKSKCLRVCGLEEKIERMGSQKITVSDHMSTADTKTDNFVIAMDSFAVKNHDVVPGNSRITRSHSRKWSHRCSNEKVIQNGNHNEKKNENDPSLSPKDNYLQGQGVVTMAEKPIVGTTMDEQCSNHQQAHHQITITTINTGESRYARRNSFRRSSPSSWILDPKRILFIFATLSSIGTILLIYFTLSMRGAVLDLE